MTKQDLVERLEIETRACINFSNIANAFVKEGNISKAWDILNVAKCALTCTNQIHEQF